MKILNLYIAKTLLKYSSYAMVIVIAIFAFFKFLEEVNDIGRFNYTLLTAITYIGLTIPLIIYKFSPLAILLGCIVGLGSLAFNNELVIMRSFGISIAKIIKITIAMSMVFIFTALILGELTFPKYYEKAKKYRANALAEQESNSQGFWLHYADSFIRVDKNINNEIFNNITLIKIDDTNKFNSIIFSNKAFFDGENITMQKPNYYKIKTTEGIGSFEKTILPQHIINVSFDKDLINFLKKDLEAFSSWQLLKYINFLNNNNLSYDVYAVELYQRIVRPFTLIAMLMIAIPFIFGTLKHSSLGRKIFIGLVVSLFFELVSRIGGIISLKFDFNHLFSVSLPTLIMLVFAVFILYNFTTKVK